MSRPLEASAAASRELLIAGCGIGGLAAALAVAQAGWQVRVFERSRAFAEFGAGVQLGPNVTRVLRAWGLDGPLAQVAAFPQMLCVRSAASGAMLAQRPLAGDMPRRYGAPYATVHRADLHGLLLRAVQSKPAVRLHTDRSVDRVWEDRGPDDRAAGLQFADGGRVEGDAVIGADGLWSQVRRAWADDPPLRPTGHLAYRALARQADLPAALRSADVTVWLGPRLHVVLYPVRGGDTLNLVALVEGRAPEAAEGWDHAATAAALADALGPTCAALRERIDAATAAGAQWRLWALSDRDPVLAPEDLARGRIALLGDAAHPMLPYLAQGAGMAIEDAAVLGRELARAVPGGSHTAVQALRRYALERYARVGLVQARSRRNARIFHTQGLTRLGRDLALRALGERLLDQPWLYGGGPVR